MQQLDTVMARSGFCTAKAKSFAFAVYASKDLFLTPRREELPDGHEEAIGAWSVSEPDRTGRLGFVSDSPAKESFASVENPCVFLNDVYFGADRAMAKSEGTFSFPQSCNPGDVDGTWCHLSCSIGVMLLDCSHASTGCIPSIPLCPDEVIREFSDYVPALTLTFKDAALPNGGTVLSFDKCVMFDNRQSADFEAGPIDGAVVIPFSCWHKSIIATKSDGFKTIIEMRSK